MAAKENVLSVKWSKRLNDFIIHYPRRCDGALITSALLTDRLLYCIPSMSDKPYPYNWNKENLKEELERRGYDLTTLRFSVELKKKEEE